MAELPNDFEIELDPKKLKFWDKVKWTIRFWKGYKQIVKMEVRK